jgi:perosamine synthetase
MIQNNIDKYIIQLPQKLNLVLKKIDANSNGIVFITNFQNKLIGSLSDGDIRRGMMKGHVTKYVNIKSKYINKNPFFLKYDSDIKKILFYLESSKNKKKYKCIPLVDNKKVIQDISTIENLRKYPIVNLNIGNSEINNVINAMKSGWISSAGSFVSQFEKNFSKYIGGGYSTTTTSGTTALELALKSLKIGLGDEVILPNLSFAASINSIINVGAKPVVVDINPKTWTIDCNKILKKISNKTKAIMPVHIYGQPCEMDEILKIAKSKKLFVIEDSAEALGATYKNSKIGLHGDCSCFSFYANKMITTGEGGMVVFKKKKHLELANRIKNHGMSRKKFYFHEIIGSNYRMTNIQAAIGISQLKKIKSLISSRKKIFQYYNKKLKKYKFIKLLPENNWSTNSYWLYTILIENLGIKKREKLINNLLKKGIETRPAFYPFNAMKIYKKYCKDSYKFSTNIANNSISLPSTSISGYDQDLIINILLKEIKKLIK